MWSLSENHIGELEKVLAQDKNRLVDQPSISELYFLKECMCKLSVFVRDVFLCSVFLRSVFLMIVFVRSVFLYSVSESSVFGRNEFLDIVFPRRHEGASGT